MSESAALVQGLRDTAKFLAAEGHTNAIYCVRAATALEAANKALRDIAFARPGGPTNSRLVMKLERLAVDALSDIAGTADVSADGLRCRICGGPVPACACGFHHGSSADVPAEGKVFPDLGKTFPADVPGLGVSHLAAGECATCGGVGFVERATGTEMRFACPECSE